MRYDPKLGTIASPLMVAVPVVFYLISLTGFICFSAAHSVLWFHIAVSATISGAVLGFAAIVLAAVELWNSNREQRRQHLLAFSLYIASAAFFTTNALLYVSMWNSSAPDVTYALFNSGLGVASVAAAFIFYRRVDSYDYRHLDLNTHHDGWELGN
jgi:uncharacterized membrane protein